MKFPRTVVAVHVLALIAATHYALAIDFDPNLTHRFHPRHPMPIGVDFFNQNFCGTNVVEIFVQGEPGQLLSPENLKTLDELRNELLLMPDVKSVTGLNDLFAMVDRVVGYQTTSGLPPTQGVAQASLKMLEQVQPDIVRAAITPEGQQIKISAFTTLSGFFEVLDLSERIREIVSRELPDNLVVEVSGVMPVIAQSVEKIVDSQLTGLTFCFSVVLIIVIVALRSLRLGLISLLPNLFPLLILAGCLGFGSPRIDSDYIIIFTIAFGIAVDDTIHFLHRYDVEFAHCGQRELALRRAYSYSGKAILQTTVVLGIGLSPLALSNYLTIWMLGTYLVLTLALAVLADLLFLPALILLLDKQE